jgi:4-hydroxy-tetrahydrodipicolinate synthase
LSYRNPAIAASGASDPFSGAIMQSETERIRGLGTALVTPLTAAGDVDFGALARLVDFQIEAGVNFLVPLGSTGEASTLSEAEQVDVLAAVLQAAEGRVPVLAGCTHNSTAELVARGKRFAAAGVRHVLSASPYYNKPTQEGIVRHYRALRDATGLAIAAYTIPARTAGNIVPETVERLVDEGVIFALKEASGSILQIQDVCRRVGERCAVLAGDDALTLPTMAVGGAGVIATAANAVPGAFRAWVDAMIERRYDKARAQSGPLLRLFEACGAESNPIPIKAALSLLGLAEAHVRLPLVPAQVETVAKLKCALAPFVN